jgi:hypothetical protein
MPAGFQCFDASGNLLFQLGNNLARIVLTGMTNSQGQGFAPVPEWAAGNRPWFTTVNPTGFNSAYVQPGFFIANNGLQWTTGYLGSYPNIKFICGIF